MHERAIEIEYLKFISDVATNNKRKRINILHTFLLLLTSYSTVLFSTPFIIIFKHFVLKFNLQILCNFMIPYK